MGPAPKRETLDTLRQKDGRGDLDAGRLKELAALLPVLEGEEEDAELCPGPGPTCPVAPSDLVTSAADLHFLTFMNLGWMGGRSGLMVRPPGVSS